MHYEEQNYILRCNLPGHPSCYSLGLALAGIPQKTGQARQETSMGGPVPLHSTATF